MSWLAVVLPSLMLNYFGQAALVLTHPEAVGQSFFMLYPEEFLLPMVILAMLATVIASQAVITGAFSLTHQAVQLGLLPRQIVRFTSSGQVGQIYLPRANWLLLGGVLLLIALFRSSGSLAAAYGIAVTGAMAIDSMLMLVLARKIWRWSALAAGLVVIPLLVIDVTFFSANLTKFIEGGFLPVLFSCAMIIVMRTWVRGSRYLHESEREPHNTMASVINELTKHPLRRVDGTAIYLSSNADYAPSALLQNLKHNHVLHKQNLLLTLRFARRPYLPESERVSVEKLSEDFTRVTMQFGYMEPPNVTQGILLLRHQGTLMLDMMSTSFFISRRHILPSAQFGMPLWQDRIYITLANNAADAADYFHIPLSRVVELGVQVTV
jgi:KUP system potassium uptake protein